MNLQLKAAGSQPGQRPAGFPSGTEPRAPWPSPTYFICTVLSDAREVCLQLRGHLLEYVEPPARQEGRQAENT